MYHNSFYCHPPMGIPGLTIPWESRAVKTFDYKPLGCSHGQRIIIWNLDELSKFPCSYGMPHGYAQAVSAGTNANMAIGKSRDRTPTHRWPNAGYHSTSLKHFTGKVIHQHNWSGSWAPSAMETWFIAEYLPCAGIREPWSITNYLPSFNPNDEANHVRIIQTKKYHSD